MYLKIVLNYVLRHIIDTSENFHKHACICYYSFEESLSALLKKLRGKIDTMVSEEKNKKTKKFQLKK